MAFAPGGSLIQQRERFGGDPREAAALVAKIARAVHYAHTKGILHRDIKPSNVLLDERGEPLVSDFGLAKFLNADAELTHPGIPVGTPAYMAPEQAAGQTNAVSVRSDVWSLGVLLYELLTGKKPFIGQGLQEVASQILTLDPPRPRTLKPALDRSLEAIVLRCLEKEPARRYPSAEALADELERWHRGEPILTRPEGWARRVGRRVRRHIKSNLAVAAIIGLALGLTVVAFAFLRPNDSGPPDTAEKIRQRRLHELEAQLLQGKKVTLIGENGLPQWWQWSVGETALGESPARDKTLLLHGFTLSLLELLPDPKCEHYRLQAEVRHVDSKKGLVGIYFSHGRQKTADGVHHFFCELTFNDRESTVPKSKNSTASMKLRHYREPAPNDTGLLGESHQFLPALLALNARQRQDPEAQPWRKLTVEVSPRGVSGSFGKASLGQISRKELMERAAFLQDQAPAAQQVPVAGLTPRGALGLFVYRGAAAFRRVVVEPLPKTR
jgi:serine/threonine-protein kinase